jgi:hypothetical protein
MPSTTVVVSTRAVERSATTVGKATAASPAKLAAIASTLRA